VSAPANARRAVFLDRDGVVNELVWDSGSGSHESPYRPQDVALAPGAAAALRSLRDHGFRLVVVSNQPAAAKGTTTLAALRDVAREVEGLLVAEGVRLDASRYCFHHPDGTDPVLSQRCRCRKPEPGLILDAALELGVELGASWAIGDADRDVEAGRRAGCRGVLIDNPDSRHRRQDGVDPYLHASDLEEAAAQIIRTDAYQ
jgi:D-glycero-D-manno-heptose 1,7-bisphosphate phosphatase